jgi:hypothetical protein
MPHLTSESFDQYDSSNLGGCQFVDQGILYLLTSVYFPLYPILNAHCSELFVTNFIIFVLSKLGARGEVIKSD